ncbi:RING-H2 finger protein ATL13 [Rhynchospora pubera]|uniref:RING-H2 finger protein ATL13 n=1 Tax=Rhynchospora pubera TaxID=906938 RepID=A0AAV8EAZ2_9POAL|nr:RING-H2 finger protein ATL13 [Rhynchospora pubera]KAJ4804121.1 RING-H2 finger protein ATL13 [Rhynchospora pubera]
MGFPSFYYCVILPKPLILVMQILDCLQQCIFVSLLHIGLLQYRPDEDPIHHLFFAPPDPLALAIKNRLQVVRFSSLCKELRNGEQSVCAVCLAALEGRHEVRKLGNCSHLFHKGCIDRWVELGQVTCPLCRSPLLPRGQICHSIQEHI